MEGLENKVVGVGFGGIWEIGSDQSRRVGTTKNQSLTIAHLSNVSLLKVTDPEDERHPQPIMKLTRQEQSVELPLKDFDRYSFVPWVETVKLINEQPKEYSGRLEDRINIYQGDLILTLPNPKNRSLKDVHFIGYLRRYINPGEMELTNAYPRFIVKGDIGSERKESEIIDLNRAYREITTEIKTADLLSIIVLRRWHEPFKTYPDNPYPNPINFTKIQ